VNGSWLADQLARREVRYQLRREPDEQRQIQEALERFTHLLRATNPA
jgi:hypothetical protein